MDKITGGNESTYLDSLTRSRLWERCEDMGIKRNEIVKTAILHYLNWLDQMDQKGREKA